MVDTETIRTIIGMIGNVISFCLFMLLLLFHGLIRLILIFRFIQIVKRKSVQDYRPDPYVATVLNCKMWVFYGLPIVHPDSILIVTINGIGLAIEFVYVLIFILYSPWSMRRKIIITIIVEVLFIVVVIVITLLLLHTTTETSNLVGVLCIIFNIMMSASPLTIKKKVIVTKSVKYVPFSLSFVNFCNGLIWATCTPQIPIALGALSGLVQLIIYAAYYRTTKWDDKSSEIKLSEA